MPATLSATDRLPRLTIRTGALALTVMTVGLAAGCGSAADDPAPGGITAREAEALNDAAAMLDNTDEGIGNVE